jgi:hypothetical protein
MFPPPLLTGTSTFDFGLSRTSMAMGLVCNQAPGGTIFCRVVSPSPRPSCALLSADGFHFTLSQCHSLLFAPFPACRLHSVVRRFGTYHAVHRRRIRSSSGNGHHTSPLWMFRICLPYERFDDGPRWAARPRQSARGRYPLWAVQWLRWISPPLSRDRSNEVIGGGDIHRSSISPSFRGSNSFRAPPRRPGFASGQKRSMTAWWLVINRILKRGGKCRHHGDGV